MATMGWKTLLLSPRGRIGRRDFWLGFGVLMAGSIILTILPVVGQFAGIVLVWPLACILTKRLHDAGRSGWLLLLPLSAFVLALGRVAMATGGGLFDAHVMFDAARGPVITAFAVAGLLALVFVVWVGLSKGEAGPNRYGGEIPEEAAA